MPGPSRRHPVFPASRRLHRWGALLVAAPLLLVVSTGLLLMLKKQVPWLQPQTLRAEAPAMTASFDDLLRAARSAPEAGIESWDDVDRIDVRPGRGIAKVRSVSGWEVQVDTATGEALQTAYRRSDLIESLHDGSFFGDGARYGVFLPAGVVLLGLLATGVVLWWRPIHARRRSARLAREMAGRAGGP